jgi:hypothetical protein
MACPQAQRAACCAGHGAALNAETACGFSSGARAEDTRAGGRACYDIALTVAQEAGSMSMRTLGRSRTEGMPRGDALLNAMPK